MTELNEIKYGFEIGLPKSKYAKFQFIACPRCGAPRWLRLYFGKPKSPYCASCYPRKSNPLPIFTCYHCGESFRPPQQMKFRNYCSSQCYWESMKGISKPRPKASIKKSSHGYMLVLLPKGGPFYSMADRKGYVQESRLILAQHLGRPLTSRDIVHHINENILDNRLENLAVMTRSQHQIYHWHKKHSIPKPPSPILQRLV